MLTDIDIVPTTQVQMHLILGPCGLALIVGAKLVAPQMTLEPESLSPTCSSDARVSFLRFQPDRKASLFLTQLCPRFDLSHSHHPEAAIAISDPQSHRHY